MSVSVVIPTFNEAGNVMPLVDRLQSVLAGYARAEVVFVDDSSDETPSIIREAASGSELDIRLIHRDVASGGLSGAVLDGIAAAAHDRVIVMDGDLQHPPETIPALVAEAETSASPLIVASRYAGGGDSGGLVDAGRQIVSRASTLVTRGMFPWRLRNCTDPMTGFFLLDRSRVDLRQLRPRGFKILLEIIVRQPRSLPVSEVPFSFADRPTGVSKAGLRNGIDFVRQLVSLRLGRVSSFAVVGALGAIVNLVLVWLLSTWGLNYLLAALLAAEVTIIGNFLLQERFVFRDMITGAGGRLRRFAMSVGFNNVDAAIRIPALLLLVGMWRVPVVIGTAITLVIAFAARYAFHLRLVYGRRQAAPAETATIGASEPTSPAA
jgi:dolichol-phosphate mannosyltransferase